MFRTIDYCRASFETALIGVAMLAPSVGLAQPPVLQPVVSQPPAPPTEVGKSAEKKPAEVHLPLVNLAEEMIADALPRHYANEKEWNRQKHFSTGLAVEREGLKIETRRKKELINHGTWKRYSIDVPEGQKLRLDVSDVVLHDGGRVTFRVVAESPVRGRVELQEWQRGVRILGISADCDAAVRLSLDAEAVLRSERGTLLPTVSVAPKITKAHVELLDFRLRRIGDLRGSAAKELGDAAEPTLRREVADQDEKIAAKLNKAIAKRTAELRVSGDDFLKEKWNDLQAAIHKKSASKEPAAAIVQPGAGPATTLPVLNPPKSTGS